MNKIEGYCTQNGEPTPDNPAEIKILESNMIDIVNLKDISERFNNGTETIEDIINYCRNYELYFGSNTTMQVVEKKYFDKLVERIKELEEENEKNIERYEERDNEVWERVKQCKNMQTEIDRLYIDKKELQQAYLHEKLAKEEVEELLEESIPKQKVKDKIENLKEQRRILGFKTYLRIEDMLNDDKAIMHEISTLEELLEESK